MQNVVNLAEVKAAKNPIGALIHRLVNNERQIRIAGYCIKELRKAHNINRLLIYGLIVSNFISWILLLGAMGSIVTHTHDIDLPQAQQQQLMELPPIEEVK